MRPQIGRSPADWELPASCRTRATVAVAGLTLRPLHGSGYAICSARTHRGITTRLARRSGLPVFAADYRLAPRLSPEADRALDHVARFVVEQVAPTATEVGA